MLEYFSVVVTPFVQNARVVFDPKGKEALVIDPGGEAEKIYAHVEDRGLAVKEIWLTHSHLDHCGGVQDLLELTGATLFAHPCEQMMRAHVTEVAAMYGIPEGCFKNCPEPTRLIEGGETLQFAGCDFKVLHTPGHSPGHLSFYCPTVNLIISGDVLFAGSIGRTDLPGGDYEQLMQTIKTHYLPLPDAVKVLCGHGEDTTIGEERRSNPFLQ